MKKSPVIMVVAIGVGAALFFVLGRFVAIPSPVPNTNISLQYGLLGFMAGLFGPVAGLLIAFIGHALIDFSYGWGIWWSWVIASGVAGFIMGLAAKKLKLDDEPFNGGKVALFNIHQVAANLIAWGVIAPVLDIIIYAEPVSKVFTQGIVAGLVNILTAGVVGSLLCFAYTKARPQAGSLKKEEED